MVFNENAGLVQFFKMNFLTESAFSCVLSDIKLPKKLAYLCKSFTSWIFLGKKALSVNNNTGFTSPKTTIPIKKRIKIVWAGGFVL